MMAFCAAQPSSVPIPHGILRCQGTYLTSPSQHQLEKSFKFWPALVRRSSSQQIRPVRGSQRTDANTYGYPKENRDGFRKERGQPRGTRGTRTREEEKQGDTWRRGGAGESRDNYSTRREERGRGSRESYPRAEQTTPHEPVQITPPPGLSTARTYAIVCLLRVEQGGAYSDLIFGSALSSFQHSQDIRTAATSAGVPADEDDSLGSYVERTLGFWPGPLDSMERRKVTALVAGVTRWRRYLDFLLTQYWSGPLTSFDKMEPILKQIMRLGMFEMVKMNTPSYSAVDEAVKLAKAVLRPGAGSLVNGVLRAASQNFEKGLVPSPLDARNLSNERNLARALATLHSHPVWMVRRWLQRYGRDKTEALMTWNNQSPSFYLRPNVLQGHSAESLIEALEAMGVECGKGRFNPEFVHVRRGMQDVVQSRLIKDGACNVQDESAGLVVKLLDPQPGELFVDLCSAPGGKTLYAAALMRGEGRIVAIDVNEGRSKLVQQAAERQGIENMVTCVVADARGELPVLPGTADKVLVDVPCSGLGVLSKRADLRWRSSLEGEEELVTLQDELLDSASKLVKPGGYLVCSTCSIEPRENEERARSFLERHEEFEVVSAQGLLPPDFVTEEGFFRSLPHEHGIDGAFAAKFRRVK